MPKRKFTKQTLDKIKREYDGKTSYREIGRKYGMSQTMVWSIVNGKKINTGSRTAARLEPFSVCPITGFLNY